MEPILAMILKTMKARKKLQFAHRLILEQIDFFLFIILRKNELCFIFPFVRNKLFG